jgi:hypothetical protein
VRSLVVVLLGYGAALVLSPIWSLLFTRIIGSPFILLMLFFLLRGYFTGIVASQRARAAFPAARPYCLPSGIWPVSASGVTRVVSIPVP